MFFDIRCKKDEEQENDECTKVSQIVVGLVDLPQVTLLSRSFDHLIIPKNILPDGIVAGELLKVKIQEKKEWTSSMHKKFVDIQKEVYELFSTSPKPLVIRATIITQTSVMVEWDPPELYYSDFFGIDIYRNSENINSSNVKTEECCAKISGLEVSTQYEFHAVLRTSAGSFKSNYIRVATRSMGDLRALNVCFGDFGDDELSELKNILLRVSGSFTDDIKPSTTHLVTNKAQGDKYNKAKELNIPIVTPGFIKACEMKKKILPVSQFSLNTTKKTLN